MHKLRLGKKIRALRNKLRKPVKLELLRRPWSINGVISTRKVDHHTEVESDKLAREEELCREFESPF